MFGVSVSVDVDGEAGLAGAGRGVGVRLSSRSERAYGVVRGLPRVLAALAAAGARATFYVPGVTARAHPQAVRELLAAGHELAHHGHTHRRPDTLSARAQRAELVDGRAALEDVAGVRVRGYRAPGWELTPTTLALLDELAFAWDSSLMGDDRPYRLGPRLLELPVHWTLDDAPHYAHAGDPDTLTRIWLAELAHAHAEQRHITYTLHPEILGRPHRLHTLTTLLHHSGPTTTHGELAGGDG